MGAFDMVSDDDPRVLAHEAGKRDRSSLSDYTDAQLQEELKARKLRAKEAQRLANEKHRWRVTITSKDGDNGANHTEELTITTKPMTEAAARTYAARVGRQHGMQGVSLKMAIRKNA